MACFLVGRCALGVGYPAPLATLHVVPVVKCLGSPLPQAVACAVCEAHVSRVVGDSLRGLSDPVRALATKGGGVTERGQGKPPAGQRLRGLQARRNPLRAEVFFT